MSLNVQPCSDCGHKGCRCGPSEPVRTFHDIQEDLWKAQRSLERYEKELKNYRDKCGHQAGWDEQPEIGIRVCLRCHKAEVLHA